MNCRCRRCKRRRDRGVGNPGKHAKSEIEI